MQWKWTGEKIAMPVGDLGTWPATVGIGEEGGRWKEEGWSMEEEESRRSMIIQTI